MDTARPSGTVTILFTDLVSSTEMLDRLGDEAAESIRRTHFRLLREAVATSGGEEVKNLGDGLMVVFPSALDAIGCAVAMQQAVAVHNEEPELEPIHVRVGIHAGEPIVDEDDYFGTPVVIAKRLCDRAQGGQIVVSDLVSALVGGRRQFEFRDIGDLALKGVAQPLPAREVVWRGPDAGSDAATPAPAAAVGVIGDRPDRDRTFPWKVGAIVAGVLALVALGAVLALVGTGSDDGGDASTVTRGTDLRTLVEGSRTRLPSSATVREELFGAARDLADDDFSLSTTGEVADPGEVVEYAVDLKAGEVIGVQVEPTGSDPLSAPAVELVDPDGEVAASAGTDPGGVAAISRYVVATDGSYTVRVGSDDAESTGEYAIEIGSQSRFPAQD